MIVTNKLFQAAKAKAIIHSESEATVDISGVFSFNDLANLVHWLTTVQHGMNSLTKEPKKLYIRKRGAVGWVSGRKRNESKRIEVR